ncbi:MAG TPA: methylamine utilization protein [Xanthomonadaceae bacterium]|jgi:plastocyanin|nr:methylamine utilization protein [Xanthomonadaceae bacterium]
MRASLRLMVLPVFAWACASAALAAELKIQVNDDHGHPVPEAVVTVVSQDASLKPAPRHAQGSQTRIVDQKNETFIPYIQIFRPGDKVLFRNSDTMRHHVYTFSPLKPFEFILVPGQSSDPIELDQTGVIAVGCNIHDQMITYLYISDAPWMAQSGADGRVDFKDVPSGAWNVRVWHPRLPRSQPDLVQSATIVATGETKAVDFSVTLLPDTRSDFDREHTRY